MKDTFNKLSRKARMVVFTTPIEIALGATIALTAVGTVAYHHEAPKRGEVPIAYSDLAQITADLKADGQEVNPLTQFYASNNDAAMLVLEANNTGYKKGNSDKNFAAALIENNEQPNAAHKSMGDYAKEMPGNAQNALKALHHEVDATKELPAIESAFENAWSASHQDVYHTEVYFETVCTTGANNTQNCHQEMRTKQVYDYTWHSYTYHKEHGELATKLLNEFLKNHPEMTIEETLQLAEAVSAENKAVMKASRERELKGETPSDEEFLEFANTWANGSNLNAHAPKLASGYSDLSDLASEWANAAQTAKSHRYITYSHYDSGPGEYQTANKGDNAADELANAAHKIVDGITFSGKKVPELNKKINEYIDVVLGRKDGDAKELRKDIMKMSRDIYEKNHGNGFDTQTFKWLNVVLLALLGMAAGAALGEGANFLLNKKKKDWYENDGETVTIKTEDGTAYKVNIPTSRPDFGSGMASNDDAKPSMVDKVKGKLKRGPRI